MRGALFGLGVAFLIFAGGWAEAAGVVLVVISATMEN